jgi:hypothetical protein
VRQAIFQHTFHDIRLDWGVFKIGDTLSLLRSAQAQSQAVAFTRLNLNRTPSEKPPMKECLRIPGGPDRPNISSPRSFQPTLLPPTQLQPLCDLRSFEREQNKQPQQQQSQSQSQHLARKGDTFVVVSFQGQPPQLCSISGPCLKRVPPASASASVMLSFHDSPRSFRPASVEY